MKTTALFGFVIIFVLCFHASSWAIHATGGAVPYAKSGHFAIGAGYYYFQSQWETGDGECLPGDLTQNGMFLQGSYGLIPGMEVYVNLGAADLVVKDGVPEVKKGLNFEGDYKGYIGFGLRGAVCKIHGFAVGPLFQYNRYADYLQAYAEPQAKVRYRDLYDVNLGLMVTRRVEPVGWLYGGAFGYWSGITKDIEACTFCEVPSVDYEEMDNVGGVLGLRLPLGSGLNLGFEGVYKSDLSASVTLIKVFKK